MRRQALSLFLPWILWAHSTAPNLPLPGEWAIVAPYESEEKCSEELAALVHHEKIRQQREGKQPAVGANWVEYLSGRSTYRQEYSCLPEGIDPR